MARPIDDEVNCVGALAFLLSCLSLIVVSGMNRSFFNSSSKYEYPRRFRAYDASGACLEFTVKCVSSKRACVPIFKLFFLFTKNFMLCFHSNPFLYLSMDFET